VTTVTKFVPYILLAIIVFLGADLSSCNRYTAPVTTTNITTLVTTTFETPTTFKTTPGGIEYFTGMDTEMKSAESRDRDVRIVAPVDISNKNMELYLDRTYKANAFVAGFFNGIPKQPQLAIISYDGRRWAAIDNTARVSAWTPSVFPWNISFFSAKNHDGVVHVITINWLNAYLLSEAPANDFFAYYLGNAAAFEKSGGILENYTLKNAKTVFNHDSYFDANNTLTPDAVSAMELAIDDPVAWAFGFQLKLEENDKLGYPQIKQLAKLLSDKYKPGDTLGAEDYLAAEKELLSSITGTQSP
jgi:hypothetical protein